MSRDKPIEVFNREGKYMSHCSRKRAAQMVYRNKAEWIGKDRLCLLLTQKEEKEIRKRVMERDNNTCYICEAQLSDEEVTFDHVIPRSQGGTDYEDNLACCCQECNEDKADRTPEQYMYYIYFKVLQYYYLGGFYDGKQKRDEFDGLNIRFTTGCN